MRRLEVHRGGRDHRGDPPPPPIDDEMDRLRDVDRLTDDLNRIARGGAQGSPVRSPPGSTGDTSSQVSSTPQTAGSSASRYKVLSTPLSPVETAFQAAVSPTSTFYDGRLSFCPLVDVATQREVAARLLSCVATQAVHRGLSTSAAISELKQYLLPKNLSTQEPRGPFGLDKVKGLDLLYDRIARLQARKSIGGMLAGTFHGDQHQTKAVEVKVLELDRSGSFPDALRKRLAAILIRAYDAGGYHHCNADLRECTDKEAEAHTDECSFREVPCPNACCEEAVSAHALRLHDAECPHKLLPCSRGCGIRVPRGAMADHVAGDCDWTPVVCPFRALGCTAPLRRGDLDAHLVADQSAHLLLAAKRLARQDSDLAALRKAVDESTARAQRAEEAAVAYKGQAEELSKSLHAASKQVKASANAIRRLEDKMARMTTDQSKLKARVDRAQAG